MKKRRLKSAEAYSQVQDSYSLPNILSEARSHFGPYGLPLSISVSKMTSQSECGLESSIRKKRKKISRSKSSTKRNNPHQSFTSQDNTTTNNNNMGDCSNALRLAANRMAQKIRGIKSPPLSLPSMKVSATSYHKGISLRDSITSSFHSINHEQQHVFGVSFDDGIVNQNSSPSSISSTTSTMTKYPELKSYTVESETGLVFNVMEIGIPYKKNLWTDVIMKRIHSTNEFEQVLKAIILSQRGASLIWIFNNKTRIILLSEHGTADLVTWCSKILSDIQITRNFLNEQRHLWHPNIQKRLKHAAKNCKTLDSLIGQTDANYLQFTPHLKAANEVFLNSTRCIWHGLGDISKNKSNKKSKLGKFSKQEEENVNSKVLNDFLVNSSGSTLETVAVVDSRISLYPGEKTTVTKVMEEVIQKWEHFSSKVKGSHHQRSYRQIYPLPVRISSSVKHNNEELEGNETTDITRENMTATSIKSLCNHNHQEKT